MLIGHFSDLHGNLTALFNSPIQPDVWVDTGDFFPDDPVYGYGSPNEKASKYQLKWFNGVREKFLERLGGKPLITVSGNHDDTSLYKRLRFRKYPVFEPTPEGIEVAGVRWAGFSGTPLDCPKFILDACIDGALASGASVLITHAPPDGILCDGDPTWGLEGLSARLRGGVTPIRHHLFGHVHGGGGKRMEDVWGVRYYNGARRVTPIEL